MAPRATRIPTCRVWRRTARVVSRSLRRRQPHSDRAEVIGSACRTAGADPRPSSLGCRRRDGRQRHSECCRRHGDRCPSHRECARDLCAWIPGHTGDGAVRVPAHGIVRPAPRSSRPAPRPSSLFRRSRGGAAAIVTAHATGWHDLAVERAEPALSWRLRTSAALRHLKSIHSGARALTAGARMVCSLTTCQNFSESRQDFSSAADPLSAAEVSHERKRNASIRNARPGA